MDEFHNLEWTKSSETLEDILQNPRVKLPQLIRLSSQLEFLDSKISLKQKQILTILAKQKISYVNAIDSHGKGVSIPLGCPYTVKQVSPQKERFFETVEDIVKCDPLPKFVEVTKVGTLEVQDKIVIGDVFKVVFVEKSEYTLDHVHFRNSVGTLIKVSVKDTISFQYATGYSTTVLLSALLDRRHQEFPVYIQFTKQDKIPKKYLEFGMLTLPSNGVITMDIVIASAEVSSTEYVVVYPLGLGIKFEVNNKLKLANDKEYRELCSNYSHISVEEASCYLAEMIGFKESDHRVVMKYKKLKKDVQRSASFIKKESKEVNLNSSKVKARRDSLNTIPKTDVKQCDSKLAKNEKKCEGNEKEKSKSDLQKGAKETKSKKTEKEKKKKKSEKDKIEIIKNENIYVHQPPSLLSKVKAIKIRKDKSDKTTELDPKTEIPVIENLYTQIDYEFLDKIQDEIAKSPSLPLKSESPPPLPGNHPCQYASAVDSKKTDEFYFDKASYSTIEISTWGMEEVGACLSSILLTKYKTTFEDNMVDGKILIDLDESVLTELGLNVFEARKLYNFVHGWRPGSTRPSSVYPPLKGFDSDDPSDWDVEDTALHMLEIDSEVSNFCKENLVDGDLLRDICVDTPIMEFLFPGNKLKMVKIKNYVIGGWRPKPSTGNKQSLCKTSNPIDSSSGSSKPTNDTPMVARMKQQFEQKSKYCGVGVRERVDL